MFLFRVCVCMCVCIHVCAHACAFKSGHVCVHLMSVYICLCAHASACMYAHPCVHDVCVCDVWMGWGIHMCECQRITLSLCLCGFSVELRPHMHSNYLPPRKKRRQIKISLCFRQITNLHTCYSFLKDFCSILNYVCLCVTVCT